MAWTEEKIEKLTKLWGNGQTASQIADIIGDVSRNAVIGKAHRLNLSSKIVPKNNIKKNSENNFSSINKSQSLRKSKRSKFKSLIIEQDYEPENPKQLEDLDDNTCKWPMGHPDQDDFYFCGRGSLKDFSYCKLHLLYAFQPKGKKEDPTEKDKDDETPQYIEKKIKSA